MKIIVLTMLAIMLNVQNSVRAELLKSIPFDSETNDYPGLGWIYPEDSNFTSTPTIGFNGNGNHLVTLHGQQQYNSGWVFDAFPANGWQNGDTIYMRFRVKVAFILN